VTALARFPVLPAAVASALVLSVAFAQTGEDEADRSALEQPIQLPTIRVEAVREQIREIGEQWRVDPVDPVDADRWRESDRAERPGRMVWGYDSVHEMRRVEREWLDPDPHPELNQTRPVTIFKIRG